MARVLLIGSIGNVSILYDKYDIVTKLGQKSIKKLVSYFVEHQPQLEFTNNSFVLISTPLYKWQKPSLAWFSSRPVGLCFYESNVCLSVCLCDCVSVSHQNKELLLVQAQPY